MRAGCTGSSAARGPRPIRKTTAARRRIDLSMDHMLLQLQRSPEQEQAVQAFVDALHNPGSPDFHRWLTAEEFGARFGASQADIDATTGWLQSHGFTVHSVYPSGMVIDFSGTAGQVREAFHTEIHYLEVNGQRHIANMSDPQIPEALAPAVAGVVSMHDFRPHAMSKRSCRLHLHLRWRYVPGGRSRGLGHDLQSDPAVRRGHRGPGADDCGHRGYRSLQRRRLDHVPKHVWAFLIHHGFAHYGPSGAGQEREQLQRPGRPFRRR